MNKMILAVASAVICLTAAGAQAPAGATGICKDGSYWTGATKSGACTGHKGVQTWYADAGKPAGTKPEPAGKPAAMPAPTPAPAMASRPAPTPAPAVASRPAPTPVAPPAAMPATTTAAAAASSKKGPAAAAALKPTAPGGGPGMVWVNTDSNVYHCYGGTYYGKTKAGQYMTEAAAQAKGAKGERGKTCSVK